MVYASLGTNNKRTQVQSWDGLSYDDPQRDIKIFNYIFSTYLGVGTNWLTPKSTFAHWVSIFILICRALFVFNIAKNLYFMMAESMPKTNENTKEVVKSAVDSYLISVANSPLAPQVTAQWNTDTIIKS